MIKIVHDDIWDFYEKGWSLVCTTNGYVNKDGAGVMGAGIALQVRKLFHKFEYALGNELKKNGNHVFYFKRQRIFTFPTKDNWKNDSIPELIEQSCKELKLLWSRIEAIENKEIKIVMTKPGCGNGNLKWEDVAPIVEKYFGEVSHDKFLVIDNESGNSREWKGKNPDGQKGNSDYKLFAE